MKLNAKRAKSAGINTGAAIVGAVAIHALTSFASDMLAEKSPDSTLGQHIPAITAAAIVAVQMLDIVPENNAIINSALLGGAVIAGSSAIRNYTGANDDTKNSEGLAQLVHQYVPGLQGLGNPGWNYTESAHQMALPAATAWPMLPMAQAAPVAAQLVSR